jgi:hypothetical protein
VERHTFVGLKGGLDLGDVSLAQDEDVIRLVVEVGAGPGHLVGEMGREASRQGRDIGLVVEGNARGHNGRSGGSKNRSGTSGRHFDCVFRLGQHHKRLETQCHWTWDRDMMEKG